MSIRINGNKVILRDLTESDIHSIWHWNFEALDREHSNWNGPYKPLEYKPFEEFREKYVDDLSLSLFRGGAAYTAPPFLFGKMLGIIIIFRITVKKYLNGYMEYVSI